MVFFASRAPEGMDPLAYNFTYVGPEIAFTAIGSVILLKAPHTSRLFRVYGKRTKTAENA